MSAVLPPFPQADDIETLAEAYADNAAEWEKWSKVLWHIKRRLTEYVRDNGPIRTLSGKLVGIEPDGWDWQDERVAAAMPALVTGMSVTVEGPQSDVEEIVSTVATMPNVTYTLGWRIDKVAAARVVREGGAPGEAVAACRSPKGKLGIRP